MIHPILLCVSQAFERDFVLPLLNNQNVPYIKLSADTRWQSEILNNILSIYKAKSNSSAVLEISACIIKIWSIIFRNTKAPAVLKNQNSDFTILKNMIGYIQKFYREKITLDDIATAGAVGQSKCCKLFDKYIGVTPNAYLIQYRLHQSTWYLKNTDMTITQIASTVGFSGGSYYAEAFKKHYNKSPSEYRKQFI